MPKIYVLNLTNRCNNNCTFCYWQNIKKIEDNISFDEIKKEILLAKEEDYDAIDFFGKEPTLCPFLFRAIEFSISRGFRCHLATNARKFSSDKFSKRLLGLPICQIRTSLHSHKKEIHDKITRVKGSFEETLQGIKNIQKYNKYNTDLMVNIVINKLNYRELSNIASFLDNLGIRKIKFSGLISSPHFNFKKHPEFECNLDDIRPYLLETLEYLKSRQTHFLLEKLPICIASVYHDRFIAEKGDENFVKLKQCKGCPYFEKCIGVDRIYKDNKLAFLYHQRMYTQKYMSKHMSQKAVPKNPKNPQKNPKKNPKKA